MLSLERRRQAVTHARTLGYFRRRISKALGISYNPVRCAPQPRNNENALKADTLRFAVQYGRYGYLRVHALLRSEGWEVSHGRVMRLWLNDRSCIRLRRERRNSVWLWDFLFDRTHDGRPIKLVAVIDEYNREYLAVDVARRAGGRDAIDVFSHLMETHGTPEHIRSDNDPEMVAKTLLNWLGCLSTKTIYMTPGSPWENVYCESFNGKLRNELFNGELFYTLRETQVLIDQWWVFCSTKRPHSAQRYRPPTLEIRIPDQEIPVQINVA